jgi:hypothetical protein
MCRLDYKWGVFYEEIHTQAEAMKAVSLYNVSLLLQA